MRPGASHRRAHDPPGRGQCQTYGRADAPTGRWKTADAVSHTVHRHYLMERRGRTRNRTVTLTDDYHLEDEHR